MSMHEEQRPEDDKPNIEQQGEFLDSPIGKEPDTIHTDPECQDDRYEYRINERYDYPPPSISQSGMLPNLGFIIRQETTSSPFSSDTIRSILDRLKNESTPFTSEALGVNEPTEEKKPEKTGPTLDDIGGYEDAKEQVRKFLAAAQHPERFREWGAQPPKGLLLYGPPGTGKTMFAKAIATELDGHFESISPADINSKWFGESEARIKKLFEDARKRLGHTVIFIDEIESMLPQRSAQLSGGVKDSIMTMFLQYMDGKDSPDNVTIVGATNRLGAIDSAVLRPGRFDRKIEIGYPDPEARAAILDIHIATKEKVAGRKLFDLDKEGLAKLLKGADVLTGAQIAEVVRRMCEAKAYEALEKGEAELVTVDDLAGSFASLIAESARYDS